MELSSESKIIDFNLNDEISKIYKNNYPLFLEINEIKKQMFKNYLLECLEYINNVKIEQNILLKFNYIAVGDVHGSLIQLFAPLVKYQLIKNVNYDFKSRKFTFEYIQSILNYTKIIYVGDIICRGCHGYGFPMMEALIEIEKHFRYLNENVIYLNGNHEIGFMLCDNNTYGLYDHEFDEYVLIYENGLDRKNEILNEKRKIIYQHIIESPYPFAYAFTLKNIDIFVSHTLQYIDDIPDIILNNLLKIKSLNEKILYLNELIKCTFISGSFRLKEKIFMSFFCKRPSGDSSLYEYLDNIMGTDDDCIEITKFGNENQTLYNSKILDEILFNLNDSKYNQHIHIIGHTPTCPSNEENPIIKYIDNDKLNMKLYCIDCNSANNYKYDNTTLLILNEELEFIKNINIHSIQIKSEFYLEEYINKIKNKIYS